MLSGGTETFSEHCCKQKQTVIVAECDLGTFLVLTLNLSRWDYLEDGAEKDLCQAMAPFLVF